MSVTQRQTQGFTVIELLIVVAIIGIIATISIIGFRNFASFQQYNQAVSDVTFILNQTRLNARSAELDSSHGVKIMTSSLTQFIGDSHVVSDPLNQVTNYNLVEFDVNLTGGVDEIVFDKLTGLPSATGTIVVEGTVFAASTTIEITSAGIIQ